ncbi:hypothetical protein [Caminibacter mediatlanticus]|uniref:HlyD family efflux transporter periplasmic adaptor subunit n=1 Tax=Caminibacter mediatlanticus TB-2 TaxID=391592 RepID=A0AAI9AGF4_9BACT|nr:hypothetical protein [Caminibacter mediatlanticus]EDM23040.1 hypothetical protein CMTB2_00309 [Caminibacter mediatlanticus TB-2]
MKKILFFVVVIYLFAFDGKVEPFMEYDIKSAVGGEVVLVNKNLEAKNLKNQIILKVDDYQDKINLENLKINANLLKKQIKNQEEIVKRKKDIYEKYKTLKTKSQTEKDLKFFDYIASYNQLLTLKSQYENTISNIKKLQDTINKKSIKVSGYLYKLYTQKGDYLVPGKLVAKVYDISKQKIDIYVPIDFKLDGKDVYINGKKSNFKIYKKWKVTDENYITSYKVELVGNGLRFGDIVKVDLK